MTADDPETTLDLTGLACPLPVLRTNKALKSMAGGTEVRVLATDPAAPADFRAYCATAGHEFVGSREEAGIFVIVLRKQAS